MRFRPVLLVMLLLVSSSFACIATDVKDAVETLDKTAELLQEIAESGTWTYITKAMDALSKNPDGYTATVQFVEGTTAGSVTITEETDRMLWEMSVDEQGESIIRVTHQDNVREYLNVNSQLYLIEDGKYRCVQEGSDEGGVFGTDAAEVFAQYSGLALGLQTMSVAEEDGTETINNIATKRYKLISKLEEAVEILSEFPSDDLQKELDELPEFEVEGTLYIDAATEAVIKFDASYANLDENKGNQFVFEITELGGQPDYTMPAEADIVEACPEPAATPTAGSN
jgi:hypothetical protein